MTALGPRKQENSPTEGHPQTRGPCGPGPSRRFGGLFPAGRAGAYPEGCNKLSEERPQTLNLKQKSEF